MKLALSLATLMVLLFAGAAAAHNWGADPSDLVTYCTATPDSECSADNQYHYLYYNGPMPTPLRDAFNRSLDTDYYIQYELFSVETAVLSIADVVVRMDDIPNVDPAAYTKCSTQATFGGSGWNRWCKRQIIELDNNDPEWADDCFTKSSNHCRNWVACHEAGHTLGLLHTSRSTSCLTKKGPDGTQTPNVDGHDREHLADCYPHPTGYFLTTACDTYEGNY